MNFVTAFKEGKEGKNMGPSTGIAKLDLAMLGVPRKSIIGVAAAPKVGKSKFVDYAFVLSPYLLAPAATEIDWIYFSYEMDRISKEFNFAAFYFSFDYKIETFVYPGNGKTYEISSNYLMGKLIDEVTLEPIKILPTHESILKEIYIKRIIPMFGEYDVTGKQIRKGKIDFIEQRENPTGIRNYLLNYAKANGEFLYQNYTTLDAAGKKVERKRVIGYRPNNPAKYCIIITDTMRKIPPERGFTTKQTVDKMLEYQEEIRNLCHFTFIDIIHLNRSMADVERLKYMKDCLYPTGEDIKDTGNLSEACNYLFTMFNANDDKYNLNKHFGMPLTDRNGKILYPNYRSLHLVESRETFCPRHIRLNMRGSNNQFSELVPIQ